MPPTSQSGTIDALSVVLKRGEYPDVTAISVSVSVAGPIAPSAPTLTGPSLTNDETPTLSGTADAGTVVTVYDGTTALGQATADTSSGSYTLTAPTLTEGSHSITATAADSSGNESAASTTLTLVVDTTAPVITLTGGATVAHELGTAYSDAGATSDGVETVVTSGTVDVYVAGDNVLSYSASDAAGNVATLVTRTVTVADRTAPVIASVTASWGTSLNGTEINSDGTVTVVTSDAENGQTVTVTLNGKAYFGTVAGDLTEVTVGASDLQGLTDGISYTLAANVSDAAGNAAESVSRTVVVDKKTVVQTLDLKKGWNLVSLYLEADDMAPSTLFEPIKSSLIIIKDTTSLYDPDIPEFLNTLKKMRQDKGYWVKVKEDKLLTIKGSMPKEVTVNLRSGWNLIGYPVIEPIAPSEIFKSIINDVEVLKTPFESYIPTLPAFLNTLIQMEAGGGYWVKMKKAAALKFGDGDN